MIYVGMLTYKRTEYFRQAIESLLRQTYTDWILHILDDGSEQPVIDEITEYIDALDDERIHFAESVHMGYSSGLNYHVTQARKSKADYVIWLDDDDLLFDDDVLADYIAAAEATPDATVFYGDYELVDREGERLRWQQYNQLYNAPKQKLLQLAMVYSCVPNGGAMRAVSVYDGLAYDETLVTASDYKLLFDLIDAGAKFLHVGRPILKYRIHGENMSLDTVDDTNADANIRIRREMLDRFGFAGIWGSDTVFSRIEAAKSLLAYGVKPDEIDFVSYYPGVVSIIIPTYNRPNELWAALASVYNQTYTGGLEVIVVNDGDEPIDDVVGQYTGLRQDIKLVVLNSNKSGVAAARNMGLDRASGEFIAFLDDDDFYKDWHIKTLINYMRTWPEAFIAYSIATDTQGEIHYRSAGYDGALIHVSNYIPNLCVFHHRSDARFDPALSLLEDWDYLLQFRNKTWGTLPIVTGVYKPNNSRNLNTPDIVFDTINTIYTRYPVENESIIEQRSNVLSRLSMAVLQQQGL